MAVIHKLPVSTFLKYLIMILGTILFVQMPGGTSNGFVYPYFVIGYAIMNGTFLKMKHTGR